MSRIPLALAPVTCRLEVDETLVADVVDHEGRPLLVADLRDCACGSGEGFELLGGEVICAACLDWDAIRAIAAARRLRAVPPPTPARPAASGTNRGRNRGSGQRQARAASG